MKFHWKIFWLCIGVYVLSLTITGVAVTENSYRSALNKEVERCLREESGIQSTLTLYLMTNQKLSQEKLDISSYSQNMVDMFGTKGAYMEVFDEGRKMLSSSAPKGWKFPREELEAALRNGRNYILRRNNGRHYLFVTDLVQVGPQRLLVSIISDVTHIDEQRRNQYLFFFQIGLAGLLLVGLGTGFMSKLVIKPIEKLSRASQHIASGNYQERVEAAARDEVGFLAEQFNIMAAEIEKKVAALEAEGERKQRFIDNLTHELRTPLTSVIGYSDLMLNIKYDEKVFGEGLRYVNSEGRRMLKMVNTLMDMILLRQNAFHPEKQRILPLLSEVSDIMRMKAEQYGVILEIRGEDFEVKIDWDLLKAALVNIVDNAVNASTPGSTVILGTEYRAGRPTVYIRDRGKGMAAEEINRVLEPFYRVDKSRSRKDGGLGLGLSICSEIVKAHAAELQIESEAGEGTDVKILFQTGNFTTS